VTRDLIISATGRFFIKPGQHLIKPIKKNSTIHKHWNLASYEKKILPLFEEYRLGFHHCLPLAEHCSFQLKDPWNITGANVDGDHQLCWNVAGNGNVKTGNICRSSSLLRNSGMLPQRLKLLKSGHIPVMQFLQNTSVEK